MADIFGAAAAATAIIGQSLNLIRRVTSTIKHYKSHDERLECIYNDLSGIIDIIELVENLEPLRTPRVSSAVNNMLGHAEKLDLHVQSLKEKHSTRSPARQVINQLMDGAQDLEDTKKMVGELTTLKATLMLEIQVVNIRLFVERDQTQQNESGCTYVLNKAFLQQVNQAVEQRLGKGNGLRILELLQRKTPDGAYSILPCHHTRVDQFPCTGNGMICLTKEEYEDLASYPLGENDVNSQPGPTQVLENTCDDRAFQVNGSVSDIGAEVTHAQTIKGNQARGQSIQMNGSMDGNALGQMLASRNKTMEAIAKPRQRQQPPPVYQQLVNGPRQARAYSPRPNYGLRRANKRSNPRINGTQGTLPALGQVAMAERQVSVVVSQFRADDDGRHDRILESLDDISSNRDGRAS
ncbi:uncharacterized protein NECHADRAFT_77108 [Fusarium vanettenii 77-13-4]|uniref:Uncharacterized protein n=1 Tax=Fusarium vanettenii (strain ATCC MYA-4622 / CBS 123669 / FGSC 9596 / NRRL 45880 / 77-13-4) TaxID=660122 RepID=C7ZCM9_FUSV7|nr:uncharacterized protein NECHADRAFT_77108 [Fusarium vanettenii 77-13-4]EEU38291.1 predicted protein [Fusarium vanettenii 77-13-4]